MRIPAEYTVVELYIDMQLRQTVLNYFKKNDGEFYFDIDGKNITAEQNYKHLEIPDSTPILYVLLMILLMVLLTSPTLNL